MKKITAVLIFVIVLANTFAQTTASEWMERARVNLIAGDWNNVITATSEAINRGSTNLDAYWWRGLAYSYIGNNDASISDLNFVISQAPNFPNAYSQRGFVYGTMGMLNRTIADYRTALERGFDPTGGNWTIANSPNVNSSMWLLGLIHMEIVINRFLGNNDAVTRYDNLLRTLCTDTNVTRADVEAFYRNGIRGLISATVDEEFNRISFFIENIIGQRANSFNGVLTRNPQNGHYTLRYTDARDVIKELTAQTLEALSSAMSRSGEFSQNAINTVRTQAGLIPAVVLSDRALDEIKTVMTNFFVSPGTETFNAVREVYSLYTNARLETGRAIFEQARLNCIAVLTGFNEGLARRVIDDTERNSSIRTLTREQQQRLVQLR